MQKRRELLWDIICDIIGSIFYSIGIYTFAKAANFAPGGITGLALMANHLWKLPIGVTTLLLNIPLVLVSWKVVGKRFLFKTARTMVFCTIFLDMVFPHIPMYTGSPFLASLYSGVFLGVGMGLFYMRGSSSGGIDLLTMTLKKLKPHFSVGILTIAADVVVLLLGWPVFGNVDAVLLGLTSVFATSVVIDKILYGIETGTLVIIITDKGEDVAARIGTIINRGSTAIKGMGTFTKQKRDVLLCACSKSQAFRVQKTVSDIDEDAFVMMTETSQVFGEGFIDSASN